MVVLLAYCMYVLLSYGNVVGGWIVVFLYCGITV